MSSEPLGSDREHRKDLEREVDSILALPESKIEDKITFLETDQDNPVLYAMLCDRLRREPGDIALYARGIEEDICSLLEFGEDLDHEPLPQITTQLVEAPQRYGIELEQLSQLNIQALVAIARGLYNLELSDNILRRLNPDEIIAKYFAAGLLKYKNGHKTNGTYRHTINEPMDMVRLLDREAYPRLAAVIKKWPARFEQKPGEQMRRLSEVDASELYKALSSFKKDYMPPCITPRDKSATGLAGLLLNYFEIRYNYSL